MRINPKIVAFIFVLLCSCTENTNNQDNSIIKSQSGFTSDDYNTFTQKFLSLSGSDYSSEVDKAYEMLSSDYKLQNSKESFTNSIKKAIRETGKLKSQSITQIYSQVIDLETVNFCNSEFDLGKFSFEIRFVTENGELKINNFALPVSDS